MRERRSRRAARRLALVGVLASGLALPVGAEPAGAIIGGYEVDPADYPQFVPLRTQGCGATVIADDTLLTAAHCVDDAGQAPGPLVNGWFFVSLTIHPLWNGDVTDGHDLAIIRVQPGSTRLAGIVPIQVGSPWDSSYYAADTPATMLGRGSTYPGGPVTEELRRVDTVLRSDSYMDDVFRVLWVLDYWNETSLIGAGSTHHTVCNGDSGGPLMVRSRSNGNWILAGVASLTPTSHPWTSVCSPNAAGFSELRGAQLAWVAHEVPAVQENWPACVYQGGAWGVADVRYQTAYNYPDFQRDGPYYWEVSCEYHSSSPPPPPPPPPPEEDPDDPPLTVCDRQPWKCPDESP